MINKVLFLMERYCDADPKCGPTNSEHLVVSAIKSTGLVKKTKRFYFDVLYQQLGRNEMAELLLEDCLVFNPDLIIYTPLGGDLGKRLNPPRELISKILNELKIKIFLILWDAKPGRGAEIEWFPYTSYLGAPDSLSAFLSYRESFHNVLPMYSAVDPNSYYNKNLVRDIDVSFVGSIDPNDVRWPLRNESIRFLRDNGINIFVGGGQRSNKRLSVGEFSDILNRSKISLNFCRDGNGLPILKSRVFEITSCGALMMEDEGTDTQKLFEPNIDFVVFKSKEELLSLVRYYLKNEELRQYIAISGCQEATDIYNAKNMWRYIFEKIGLDIPEHLKSNLNYIKHKSILDRLE